MVIYHGVPGRSRPDQFGGGRLPQHSAIEANRMSWWRKNVNASGEGEGSAVTWDGDPARGRRGCGAVAG